MERNERDAGVCVAILVRGFSGTAVGADWVYGKQAEIHASPYA